MITEAIVLAGGFGTRLQPVVSDVPKSMAPVNGRPFLEYLLDYIASQGIRHVVLSVGYKATMIRDHFGDKYSRLSLSYAEEAEPMGTGGGIKLAFGKIESDEAFVLNGDSLFIVQLGTMENVHRCGQGLLTIALRHTDDSGRYGAVKVDALHRIKGFVEKSDAAGPGFINGGVYILNKDFITGGIFPDKFSLENDCFAKYWGDVTMLGFPSDGYFLDIGIPADYKRAQHEFGNLEYR